MTQSITPLALAKKIVTCWRVTSLRCLTTLLFSIFTEYILLAFTDVTLDHQFRKASGVIMFSRELQVWTFSNHNLGCGEDIQATDNVTADHMTFSVAEWYMQMPFVAGKCANQRLYFERSCEFSYFLENINIVCVIIWSNWLDTGIDSKHTFGFCVSVSPEIIPV